MNLFRDAVHLHLHLPLRDERAFGFVTNQMLSLLFQQNPRAGHDAVFAVQGFTHRQDLAGLEVLTEESGDDPFGLLQQKQQGAFVVGFIVE